LGKPVGRIGMKTHVVCLLLVVFGSSCRSLYKRDYTPDWELPTISHTLSVNSTSKFQLLWEKIFYVVGSTNKVQCLASQGVLVLMGSPDSKSKASIYALDGNTGSNLWNLDITGVLTASNDIIYIGSGEDVYAVEPVTGRVIWQKSITGARNITSLMFYESMLYIDATGFAEFYTIDKNGQNVEEYKRASDFYSANENVPFFPTLPYGYIAKEDIFIEQRGSGLYSANVINRYSNKLLWKVEGDSISNYIVFGNYVTWISQEDQIKFADKYKGNVIWTIEIKPSATTIERIG